MTELSQKDLWFINEAQEDGRWWARRVPSHLRSLVLSQLALRPIPWREMGLCWKPPEGFWSGVWEELAPLDPLPEPETVSLRLTA